MAKDRAAMKSTWKFREMRHLLLNAVLGIWTPPTRTPSAMGALHPRAPGSTAQRETSGQGEPRVSMTTGPTALTLPDRPTHLPARSLALTSLTISSSLGLLSHLQWHRQLPWTVATLLACPSICLASSPGHLTSISRGAGLRRNYERPLLRHPPPSPLLC